MRILISTGEVSGDLQGALLVEALLRQSRLRNLDLEIVALGGDRMATAGATLLGNTASMGAIGLLEALTYVLPTLKLQRRVHQFLHRHPPDLVVLIDYMGANLPLGSYIRRHFSVPIVYYIAPPEWVWSHSRQTTTRIVELSDRLLAIFPEEARYYASHGGQVTWVGHPLVDRVQAAPDRTTARQQLGIPPEQLAIALMPASRQQEIRILLPLFLQAARRIHAQLPQARFWLPLSLEHYRPAIAAALEGYQLPVQVVNDPLLAIAAADLVLGKSGTVNLEAALLNVPQVVVYRVGGFSFWLYQNILKLALDYVSPVNLVLRQGIVPELLQDQATPDRIAETALSLLLNPAQQQTMQQGYQQVRQALGPPGAVERAAQEILQLLTVPVAPAAAEPNQ